MEHQRKYAQFKKATKEEEKLSPDDVIARREAYEYSREKRDSGQVGDDYETYIYKGPEQEGTLFRVFIRHKQAGNINISFKYFLSINTHIKDVNNVKAGEKIYFPKGTKLISPKQVFESKEFKKIFQDKAFKQAYVQYLIDVKRDIQSSDIYMTNGLGKEQKAEVDALGLTEEEKRWIKEGSNKAVSITHLRYIVIPDDTRGGIAKKVGLPAGLLDMSNKWKTSGEHGGKKIRSAHPGDSVKVPLSVAKLEHFNFAKWRTANKHGGALLTDMYLNPDYIHYFEGKDKKKQSLKIPILWIHGYSLKGTNWENKAHEFIYKNYDDLKSKAKNNVLEIGIGNENTKAISVYKYQHQKPSDNTAITAHFDSLDNYGKHKYEIEEYKRNQRKQASEENAKGLNDGLTGGSVNSMSAVFKGLAAFLEAEVPQDGSKSKLEIGAYIPMGPSQVYFGIDLKFEVSKSGGNIKLSSKVGGTLRAKMLVGEAGITLGGYIDAQGKTAEDVLNNYQLALYYRLRHIAAEHMFTGTFWGYVFEGAVTLVAGLSTVLLNHTTIGLVDQAGLVLHAAINKAWGNNADDFRGAEAWANGLKGNIKSSSGAFVETGVFIKTYVGLDISEAKFKAGVEGEYTSGLRIDKKSAEQDEKKNKPTPKNYPSVGRELSSLAFKFDLGWEFGAFSLQVKEVKNSKNQVEDSEITCLWSFDMMKVPSLSSEVSLLLPKALSKLNELLAEKSSPTRLPTRLETATSAMIITNGVDKTLDNLKASGGGLNRLLQLSLKLIPKKGAANYRGIEVILYDTLKLSFDLKVFRGVYESSQPITGKITGKW